MSDLKEDLIQSLAYELKIKRMQKALIQMDAFVRHWRLDREAKLLPSPETLDAAEQAIKDGMSD